MMENQANDEAAEPTCTACLTVPVSHLQLEVDVPISGSWQQVFDELEIRVLTDTAGRPAISTLAARKLFASLRRRSELAAEDAQRRTERLAKKYPIPAGRGIPAQEGMTPFESLVAAGGVVSPQDEFGGRPKPRFLEDEILAGEQEQAARQRLATERAKQRLADQMKDKLR